KAIDAESNVAHAQMLHPDRVLTFRLTTRGSCSNYSRELFPTQMTSYALMAPHRFRPAKLGTASRPLRLGMRPQPSLSSPARERGRNLLQGFAFGIDAEFPFHHRGKQKQQRRKRVSDAHNPARSLPDRPAEQKRREDPADGGTHRVKAGDP